MGNKVTLYVGPPAAGKTWKCFEQIEAAMRENPMKPVWVIVPGGEHFFHGRLAELRQAVMQFIEE